MEETVSKDYVRLDDCQDTQDPLGFMHVLTHVGL